MPGGQGVREVLRLMADYSREYWTEENLPTFEGAFKDDLEVVLGEVWAAEGVNREEWWKAIRADQP